MVQSRDQANMENMDPRFFKVVFTLWKTAIFHWLPSEHAAKRLEKNEMSDPRKNLGMGVSKPLEEWAVFSRVSGTSFQTENSNWVSIKLGLLMGT